MVDVFGVRIDLLMVGALAVLWVVYAYGTAKGWWDPKAQKASRRARRKPRDAQGNVVRKPPA